MIEPSPRAGAEMHQWLSDLFPILRSLTGEGNRRTLKYLECLIPQLQIHEIPSGTEVGDWTIPAEWSLREAYIATTNGDHVVDVAQNNLHVVNYSTSVDTTLSRQQLDAHLHSIPELPNAVPYVTSYYAPSWGFCLSQDARDALPAGPFHVVIDSTHDGGGVLNYADVLIPGETDLEVLLTTYICHPSMANNELSGPVVLTALAQWLAGRDNRYSYRLVFSPETIGAVAYANMHLDELQSRVIAGWVLTCVGDERTWSFMPSRTGTTLADRVSRHVLNSLGTEWTEYSFLERGSDERQYCSPLVDLPFASVMRSKYAEFPEYHTSLDDPELVTPTGLAESLAAYQQMILTVEANDPCWLQTVGEPQLGKRGLYSPTGALRTPDAGSRLMLNLTGLADGRDLIALADALGVATSDIADDVAALRKSGLIGTTRPGESR